MMSFPRATSPSRLAMAVAVALVPVVVPVRAAEPAADVQATLDTLQVVGHGTGTAESLAAARARLAERAGGTAVVDGDAYRGRRASTLGDALGDAPGVFAQSRFGAEEARLSIRGSGLQRTFHGRGIALLQDGSPLNLADGSFDFQAVEPLAARHVTVHRGANALEYGAAMLGGAIDFVSRTGLDGEAMTARIEAGSDGYRRGQFALGGTAGRADGYLSLTGLSQDGYRAHARQENVRVFGNLGFRFGDGVDGRLYLTHVDTRSELPGNLTFAEHAADPSQAAPGNIALDQRRDYALDRAGAKLAWAPSPGQSLLLSAFVADKSLDHPIFQVLRQDSRDRGVDLRWRGEGRFGASRNQLVAGVAWSAGEVADRRFANQGGVAGAPANRFDQEARNLAWYVENRTWLAPRWVVSLGAQGLRAQRRSRDLLVSGGRDESFSADYRGTSPKLGLLYDDGRGLQAFANASRSLEPPTFGELSGGPGVAPVARQRATTGEFGMRLQRNALWLDAALYHARIEGELLSLTDAGGNPLGTVNAGRTMHRGVELAARWQPLPEWRLSANYLFSDFRFDGDLAFGDNRLAGMPRQWLRAELRWSPVAAWHVAPHVEWVPDDVFVDHANTVSAPGYATLGLRLGGEVRGGWRWFADLRNLADRHWIAGTGVVADAGGMDGRYVLPGDGRSAYFGVELRR